MAEEGTHVCPCCGRSFPGLSARRLNAHINECVDRGGRPLPTPEEEGLAKVASDVAARRRLEFEEAEVNAAVAAGSSAPRSSSRRLAGFLARVGARAAAPSGPRIDGLLYVHVARGEHVCLRGLNGGPWSTLAVTFEGRRLESRSTRNFAWDAEFVFTVPAFYGPSPVSLDVTCRTWLLRTRTVAAEGALVLAQALEGEDAGGGGGGGREPVDDGESKEALPAVHRRAAAPPLPPLGAAGGPRVRLLRTAIGDFHARVRFADLRGLGTRRRSPLHAAAAEANGALLRELLRVMGSHWCYVRAGDGSDMTPLDAAAAAGSVDCVRALLDAASPSDAVAGPSGRSALHFAVAGGGGDAAAAAAAAPAAGATARATCARLISDAYARGAAGAATGGPLFRSMIDVRDARGDTPVALAAARGEREVVEVLLRSGADLGIVNEAGETPLMRAIRGGHVDLAEALLRAGGRGGAHRRGQLPARPHARNKDGVTALMLAAERGDVGLVRALVAVGARRGAASSAGDTALHFAASRGHADVLRVLAARPRGPITHRALGQSTGDDGRGGSFDPDKERVSVRHVNARGETPHAAALSAPASSGVAECIAFLADAEAAEAAERAAEAAGPRGGGGGGCRDMPAADGSLDIDVAEDDGYSYAEIVAALADAASSGSEEEEDGGGGGGGGGGAVVVPNVV